MTDSIPDDDTGDALRRLQKHGADLSQPIEIDFNVQFDTDVVGVHALAKLVAPLGYEASPWENEAGEGWTLWCSRRMIPSHADITACERQLDELARPLGGYIDGWGSFGT